MVDFASLVWNWPSDELYQIEYTRPGETRFCVHEFSCSPKKVNGLHLHKNGIKLTFTSLASFDLYVSGVLQNWIDRIYYDVIICV